MSAKLPDIIKKNYKHIVVLEDLEHNLCFWGCLAIADGKRRDHCLQKAQELFKNYYGDDKSIESYTGFDFNKELDAYENFNTKYAINIIVYNDNKTINLRRRSQYNKIRTQIHLILDNNHFAYIKDLKWLINLVKRMKNPRGFNWF